MKLIKDNVIKEVPENLISIYISMGWKEYKKDSGFKVEKPSPFITEQKNEK